MNNSLNFESILQTFQIQNNLSEMNDYLFELDSSDFDCDSIDENEKEGIDSIKNQHNIKNSLGQIIESILIAIYNSHISNDKKYNDILLHYEKSFEPLSQGSFEVLNLQILHILLRKIKDILKGYKILIIQKNEIKKIHKFFLKVIGDNQVENNNKYNTICNSLLLPKHELPVIYDNVKKIIITFIQDLYFIKKALVSAVADIKRIFRHSLSFLKENNNIVNFDFEMIQTEELIKYIINDNFISILFFEIKKKKVEDIEPMLQFIEGIPLTQSKETTRMRTFLSSRIKKIIKSIQTEL